MAEKNYANLNTPLIVTIGLVTTIIVFGVIVPGVRALLYWTEARYDRENRVQVEYRPRAEYEAAEAAQLGLDRDGSYRWIKIKEKDEVVAKVVGIRIDTAMELYAERQAAKD